jgi:hypothetical protein
LGGGKQFCPSNIGFSPGCQNIFGSSGKCVLIMDGEMYPVMEEGHDVFSE